MSDELPVYGDPLTEPFWQAAWEGRLVIQRCQACGSHQFYPRPFCLACDIPDELEWVEAAGTGSVYSVVTVRMAVHADLEPPYQVALVDLIEGPRLTSTIVGDDVAIGDPVVLVWRQRSDGLPPVPAFRASEKDLA